MREDHVEHNGSGCIDTVADSVLKKELKKIINIKK